MIGWDLIHAFPNEFRRSDFHLQLRADVIDAWANLQRIKKEHAHLAELPTAQLVQMTANMNRDTKKVPKPYSLKDFVLFSKQRESQAQLGPEVSAVAMALRREDRAPRLLVTVWPQIIQSLNAEARVPEVRALASDDDSVWILCPVREGDHIRGGLVLVDGRISGPIVVRDIDRPLIRHKLEVPFRPGFGWVEARLLMVTAET